MRDGGGNWEAIYHSSRLNWLLAILHNIGHLFQQDTILSLNLSVSVYKNKIIKFYKYEIDRDLESLKMIDEFANLDVTKTSITSTLNKYREERNDITAASFFHWRKLTDLRLTFEHLGFLKLLLEVLVLTGFSDLNSGFDLFELSHVDLSLLICPSFLKQFITSWYCSIH